MTVTDRPARFDPVEFDLDAKYRVTEAGSCSPASRRWPGWCSTRSRRPATGPAHRGVRQRISRARRWAGSTRRWPAPARCWPSTTCTGPGVNEDLAATAVWGSQQDNLAPLKAHDGVIGIWYGKAPGGDRSGTRPPRQPHGVGTGGGVLGAGGDDPPAKSSTLPSASRCGCTTLACPILGAGQRSRRSSTSGVTDRLSRYAGGWVGFKIVTGGRRRRHRRGRGRP